MPEFDNDSKHFNKNDLLFILNHLYQPKVLWQQEFFRFLLAGFINTVFGYSAFVVCIISGIAYSWAILISTIAGSIFNYFSYGKIAFRILNRKIILRFVILYTFLYFLNLILFKLFLQITPNKIITGAMCLPVMITLTYLLNKKFVYTKQYGNQQKTDQHNDTLL